MRVSIGTIEIDDDSRKIINKDLGQKGHAKRQDVKRWVENLIDEKLVQLRDGGSSANGTPADDEAV